MSSLFSELTSGTFTGPERLEQMRLDQTLYWGCVPHPFPLSRRRLGRTCSSVTYPADMWRHHDPWPLFTIEEDWQIENLVLYLEYSSCMTFIVSCFLCASVTLNRRKNSLFRYRPALRALQKWLEYENPRLTLEWPWAVVWVNRLSWIRQLW